MSLSCPNLRLLRSMRRRSLTGHQLAVKASIHPQTVSRLLNGHVTPRPVTAAAIADALDVEVTAIFPEGGVR